MEIGNKFITDISITDKLKNLNSDSSNNDIYVLNFKSKFYILNAKFYKTLHLPLACLYLINSMFILSFTNNKWWFDVKLQCLKVYTAIYLFFTVTVLTLE